MTVMKWRGSLRCQDARIVAWHSFSPCCLAKFYTRLRWVYYTSSLPYLMACAFAGG